MNNVDKSCTADTLSILFCGDVCFKLQQELDEVSSRKILSGMMPIFDAADLRIMNLETALAPPGVGIPIRKSGPNIIGRPENIGFLQAARCDAVSLANNHAGDYGPDALLSTMNLLSEHGIGYFGAGNNLASAYKAYRMEKNGIRISMLGVCEHEFGLADMIHPGTAAIDFSYLAEAIKNEHSISDFVIIMTHGGCEYCPVPSPKTKERYRLMLTLGADAVIGAHPHCQQGYEFVNGKPIVYSMGNFLFKHEPDVPEGWFWGYAVRMILKKGNTPTIDCIPYHFSPEGSYIAPMTGKAYDAMNTYIAKLSEIVQDDTLLSDYYDCWCLYRGLEFLGARMPEQFREHLSEQMDIAGYLNLLNCEAHSELLARTSVLLFEGYGIYADEWKKRILELRKIPAEAMASL